MNKIVLKMSDGLFFAFVTFLLVTCGTGQIWAGAVTAVLAFAATLTSSASIESRRYVATQLEPHPIWEEMRAACALADHVPAYQPGYYDRAIAELARQKPSTQASA